MQHSIENIGNSLYLEGRLGVCLCHHRLSKNKEMETEGEREEQKNGSFQTNCDFMYAKGGTVVQSRLSLEPFARRTLQSLFEALTQREQSFFKLTLKVSTRCIMCPPGKPKKKVYIVPIHAKQKSFNEQVLKIITINWQETASKL